MIYIYDILLNFNNNFYEFFEWEKGDNLTLIKKIPLYKVDSNFIDSILTKKIKIDDKIIYEILNKCEIIENKKIKTIKYACLFTDSYRVVGVIFNNDLIVSKLSDLLLDEASDTINVSKRCILTDISYNIIGSNKIKYFRTRNEEKIENYLKDELKKNKLNNLDKLRYLYFEYFLKTPLNNEIAYDELINSFKDGITFKHIKLYDLIKLSNEEKVRSNLTK